MIKQLLKSFLVVFILSGFSFQLNAQTAKNYFIDKDVKDQSTLSQSLENQESNQVYQLITHGKPGALLIDGNWLDKAQLADWLQSSISNQTTHINIYGCAFGQGEVGQEAVNYLESTLGLTVSASTDVTGKDGDWDLELGGNVNSLNIPTYQMNLQIDTDGDGIPDRDDLDDDNDGILDCVEGNGSVSMADTYGPAIIKSYIQTQGEPALSANLGIVKIFDGGLVYNATVPGYPGGGSYTQWWPNSGNETLEINPDIVIDVDFIGPIEQVHSLLLHNDAGIRGNGLKNFDVILWDDAGVQYNESYTSPILAGTGAYDLKEIYPFAATREHIVKMRLIFKDKVDITALQITEIGLNITSCLYKDTDGDGLPDHLDTDADNDGCPDAIEAASSAFTFKDLNADGSINTALHAVDMTSTSVTYGSPGNTNNQIGTSEDDTQQAPACDTCDSAIYPQTDICTLAATFPEIANGDCDGDGVTNVQECNDGTDLYDPCDYNIASQGVPTAEWNAGDCDGDGVTNGQEVLDFTDPNDPCDYDVANQDLTMTSGAWLDADCDGDGVPNSVELANGTDPNDPCSFNTADQSGTPSAEWEMLDCDGDGVTNAQEVIDGTDPTDPCDFDFDNQTVLPTGDFLTADCDGDGITNAEEAGDNLLRPVDTDGDGYPDYLDLDSDNDGIPDSVEVGPDPTTPLDTDMDGIPDYQDTDSDGDGCPDAIEAGFTDPDGDGMLGTSPVIVDADGLVTEQGGYTGTLPAVIDSALNACAPVLEDDINTTPIDTPVSGNIFTNDETTGPMMINSVSTSTDGTLVIDPATGEYTFTPNPGFTGTVVYDVEICDDSPTPVCYTTQLTIDVLGDYALDGNNAVDANNDTNTVQQGATVATNVLANDADPDGDTVTVTDASGLDATGNRVPLSTDSTMPTEVYDANGILAGTAYLDATTGEIVFTADPAFSGQVPIDYAVEDGNGGVDSATLEITVVPDTGLNAVYANDDSNVGQMDFPQSGGVLDNDYDPDGNPFTLGTATSSDGTALVVDGSTENALPSGGTLIIADDGTYTYTPATGFVGTEVITYEICDDQTPPACDEATLYLTTLATYLINPVELAEFNAIAVRNDAELTWRTLSEINSDYFQVERSTDGTNFEAIARIEAAGDSQVDINYSHVDKSAAYYGEQVYYRLKQVDIDGVFVYSALRLVVFDEDIQVPTTVSPNPAAKGSNVLVQGNEMKLIVVYDANGNVHGTYEFDQPVRSTNLTTGNLASGQYFVIINNKEVRKLIIY